MVGCRISRRVVLSLERESIGQTTIRCQCLRCGSAFAVHRKFPGVRFREEFLILIEMFPEAESDWSALGGTRSAPTREISGYVSAGTGGIGQSRQVEIVRTSSIPLVVVLPSCRIIATQAFNRRGLTSGFSCASLSSE